MTHADFYGDGNESLVIGYATADGKGVLSLRRGNADASVVRSSALSKAQQANRQPFSPFANIATVFAVPAAPNFVATGQFLGQIDLVTAAQGGNAIYVMAGDGRGNFSAPQSFAVSGPISAMASGRFAGDTQTNSILIGTNGPQPRVALYRRSDNEIALVATYSLESPASSFDFDDLDGDGYPDAVMVSGGNVLILHAAGADGSPHLETLSLPFSAVGVLSGFFTHDRGWRRQMAVLDSNSTVHIVVHGRFDPRRWTRGEIKAMRDALIHNLPNPFRRMETGPAADGWKVLESFAGMAGFGSSGQVPLFLRTSFLRRGTDEVLVVNSAAGQADVITHIGTQSGPDGFVPGEESVLAAPSVPMAAAALTVSPSQSDLITLSQGSMEPMVSPPTSPITLTVNTTADTVDAKPGDGICADASNQCSLRAAIMEVNAEAANAVAGPFQITLPAGNFNLTIPGQATTDASTGHLDVNAPVTIAGAGASATTITQTNPSGDQDMVFLIDAAEDFTPDYAVTIQGLTITGGHANSSNLLAQGGGIHWEAGANGTGSLTLNNVSIQNNFATDPADAGVDDGGGLALFDTVSVTHPAAVTISGSSTIGNNVAFDAGGGIALKGAVSLTMTGVAVTGNQAVGGGIEQGGGLYFYVADNPPSGATSSPSFVHSSTISGNTAGASGNGEGGGIWTDQSLTVDLGSVVSSNDGEGAGGGIATDLQGTSDLVTVTASTISGNRTGGGNGGGVEVDAGSKANLNLSFNRIFGNTVTGSGAGTGLYNAGSGTPTATDNWWGCNGGPQSLGDGCDQTTGSATVSPAIQLTLSANPNPVVVLSSTTLTAAFQDSNPNFPNNLNALVSLPVSFSASNGNLSNVTANTGTNASATATFTPSNSSAQANVRIDSATVATPSNLVSDFSLIASPSTQTVNVGTASATYQITVAGSNGFSGLVALTISNADGLGATINPSQITGSGTATLTITTGSVAPGTYANITVVGKSGNVSHQVAVQLSIADFAVSISPTSQTVTDGAKAAYSVTVSSTTGFNGVISLSASGLPAGSYSFTATQINLSSTAKSGTSTLSITASPGTYSFVVRGTSSVSIVRTASAQLTVNNPPPPVIQSNRSYSRCVGNVCNPAGTTDGLVYIANNSSITINSMTVSVPQNFQLILSTCSSLAPGGTCYVEFSYTQSCTPVSGQNGLKSCHISGSGTFNVTGKFADTGSGTSVSFVGSGTYTYENLNH